MALLFQNSQRLAPDQERHKTQADGGNGIMRSVVITYGSPLASDHP